MVTITKYFPFLSIAVLMTLNLYFLRVQWKVSDADERTQPCSEIKSLVTNNRDQKKLILFWTKEFHKISKTTLNNCPFKCDFTFDKNLLNVSTAVLYEGVSWGGGKFGPLPIRGNNFDQIWIWYRFEPPTKYAHKFNEFDGQFNWTSTYRLDSDVQWSYGRFENFLDYTEDLSAVIPTELSIANRSTLVGWMDSHCKTDARREELATRLQAEGISMDIFGNCNKKHQNCRIDKCYADFAKKYKFWLAFENTLCPDYLTEKVYWPMTAGIVPIVYAHKNTLKLLPDHSYINVDDFPTMKKLAEYLRFLDSNATEYLKYFEWRKHMRPIMESELTYYCSLCTRLHMENKVHKTYKSIDDWFYRNNTKNHVCYKPTAPHF